VCGTGLRAAMAKAVLEREGYAVTLADSAGATLAVDADESGWRVATVDGEWNGSDYASLAAFLRRRRVET
jgi:hypothetical protein